MAIVGYQKVALVDGKIRKADPRMMLDCSAIATLWAEVRKHGVRVVNIRPDMTRTELYRNADFEASGDAGAALDPEDVANAVSDVLDMKEGAVITEMTITPQFVRIQKKGQK